MFKNDAMYFNKTKKVSELKKIFAKLDTENISSGNRNNLEDELIKALEDRVKIRYFSILNQWSKSKDPDKEQWGFIMMSVCCVLVELYYQITTGNDISNLNGESLETAYSNILPDIIKSWDRNDGAEFYVLIRNSLIHQAQTDKNTAISFEISKQKEESYIEGESYTIYNPNLIYLELRSAYRQIFKKAKKHESVYLRRNFLSKIRCIVFKRND